MDIILCHTTADFDTLGAAVGLSRLLPGSRIVLAGGAHPTVRDFLALHRDEYALVERRSVNPQQITGLHVVDTQWRSRLGKTADWLDLPQVEIRVYDHHGGGDRPASSDIAASHRWVEAVGAATTLIVEQLQSQSIALNPIESTVMALGIHVDTGSLTFDHSTARDAAALAWLMAQGATVAMVAEYVNPSFSQPLQALLTQALDRLHSETYHNHSIAWVTLDLPEFLPGLSNLTAQLRELTDSSALLLGVTYPAKGEGRRGVVIGRSAIEGTDLGHLFQTWGGGGHGKAASLTLREPDLPLVLTQLRQGLIAQIPDPLSARELMSSPVRTIRPSTSITEAQRILLRYGHSGLSVVNKAGELVGIISRRDLDLALHHGFGHAPVKGYMTLNPKTITPDTSLPAIENLMVTYDIGRLPVLQGDDRHPDRRQLVGIVTRTDVLRQRHRQDFPTPDETQPPQPACPWPTDPQGLLRSRLLPQLWDLLQTAAAAAHRRGWHLYLVGGGVRDLLLSQLLAPETQSHSPKPLILQDIDLVVDGFHEALTEAAGVELARELQQVYPQARLDIHGQFQTAALLWHHDPVLGSLWLDIATARTEFYPYPAANPEVEASSIQQDLYRRDFSINALALRLTAPRSGLLLDFFGGLLDLQARQVRVLHANSFIEDPTRIYRAVRFAVRLNFSIEAQTISYIRYALQSGVYDRTQGENPIAPALQTRLRSELQLILGAAYWKPALQLLGHLQALGCLHSSLTLTPPLWDQVRRVDHYLRWLHRSSGTDPASPLTPTATASPLYPWLLRLETLLAALAPPWRRSVAAKLQLPAESLDRLGNLATALETLPAQLDHCQRPSQIYSALQPYDVATLVLVAVQSAIPLRRKIWHYLSQWLMVKPPLNGHDLQQLGYRPGPQFKVILDRLLGSDLDGELGNGESGPVSETARKDRAIAFVRHHFPHRP
ncbi:CBS domain-containing protein [Prochlorothrix hollandica]|uniref:CBS domain-containing protein n=1 Tax=Prochlorothrix hollandica TaxID=1223 RepID=UPI003342776B